MNKIILASKSPRRIELLKGVGLNIEVVPSHINEDIHVVNKNPVKFVREISYLKAKTVFDKLSARLKTNIPPILGADTIVVYNGKILGKPKNKKNAKEMLQMLSGKTHVVYTGYTILYQMGKFSRVVKTKVTFKTMTKEDIEGYANTSEPYDKAGAYAAQGVGSFMIKKVVGSYTNVVGLPVCEVVDDLERLGIIKLF